MTTFMSVTIDLLVFLFGVCAGMPVCAAAVAAAKGKRWRDCLHLPVTGQRLKNLSAVVWLLPLLCGVAAVGCLHRFGTTAEALLTALFLDMLLAVSFADMKTMEIPDSFSAMIAVLGVIAIWTSSPLTLWERAIGMACVSVPLLLLALLVRGSFGGGDIKLMAACGLFLGWKMTLLSAFCGILLGGIYGVFLLCSKRAKGKDHFAFGPFLCAGMALCCFCGDEALKLVVRLFDFSQFL